MCFHPLQRFSSRGFGLRLAPQFPRIAHSLPGGHPVQVFHIIRSLKQAWTRLFCEILCGETGIRTPETLLEFTRFPGVPLQPLEHLSFASIQNRLQNYNKNYIYANFNAFFLYFI